MDYDSPKVDHNKPPFSRVFVVCSKFHVEDDIRTAFAQYGVVEDVWVVKNKITKENKGIAYVKFSKASEAALAMEKLHGTVISGDSKPIKAILADSKGSREKSDPVTQLTLNDDKHRTRIFILVPKSMEEDELQKEFDQFGKVEHVQILKDRATSESKGCAYVKFEKPSEAFNALENCESTYKAVIAEPRVPKNMMTVAKRDDRHGPVYAQVLCPAPAGFPDLTEHGATNKLTISCHTSLTEVQLTRLCDICPGLSHVELLVTRHGESKGMAYVQYSNTSYASYAHRKLHNIEYPPNYRLVVKFVEEGRYQPAPPSMVQDGYQGFSGYPSYDQNMGYDQGYNSSNYQQSGNYSQQQQSSNYSQPQPTPVGSCPYTDVALPGHLPISTTTQCRGKLFFVAAPTPIPEEVLSDVFCRFADLIDIQIIQGTAYGYIRYAMKESADAAKMLLDSKTIAGSTIRLSHADNSTDSKRVKLNH